MLTRSSLALGKTVIATFDQLDAYILFSALIGASVVAFADESINAVRVMRTPAYSGTAISVASHEVPCIEFDSTTAHMKKHGRPSVPVKAAKVPRPPNAFILYRQHHHPKLKEAHPNLSNNEICKFQLRRIH